MALDFVLSDVASRAGRSRTSRPRPSNVLGRHVSRHLRHARPRRFGLRLDLGAHLSRGRIMGEAAFELATRLSTRALLAHVPAHPGMVSARRRHSHLLGAHLRHRGRRSAASHFLRTRSLEKGRNATTVENVETFYTTFSLLFPFQIAANFVFLLCANVVGIYFQYMTRSARQKTFERTQNCVESRVKLECEKEHQEQLLLSVIPAYIAAEVKK